MDIYIIAFIILIWCLIVFRIVTGNVYQKLRIQGVNPILSFFCAFVDVFRLIFSAFSGRPGNWKEPPINVNYYIKQFITIFIILLIVSLVMYITFIRIWNN